MELWLVPEDERGPGYLLQPADQLPADLITEDRVYGLRLQGFTPADNLAGCRLILGGVDHGVGRYERTDVLSWRWEVHDYVGQVTVSLERLDGTTLWPFQEVCIDPQRHKLTRQQFATMIEDINAEALLAYSLSPATRSIALAQQWQRLGLAQLEYIRQQMTELWRAVAAIARRPRRTLFRETLSVPLAHGPAVDDRGIAGLWQHPDVLQQPDQTCVPAGARGLYQQMRGTLPESLTVGRQQI
ncbi:MAG TPA: DUF2357 domain-containing protein, partial [Anaerolineae bacterium]|nr:DUF2357 domain-containing protein [Anaerolineae bacterium]